MVALTWLGRAVLGAIVLLLFAALALFVVVPRATDSVPYTVLTGSMRPSMPPGSLLLVRPVEPDTIKPGDVVTFQIESNKPDVVTHRIVKVTQDAKGNRQFVTRGDANNTDDPEPRPEGAVRGEVWAKVPHVGAIKNSLGDRPTQVLVGGLALLAFVVMQLGSYFTERRRHRTDPVGITVASDDPAALRQLAHAVGAKDRWRDDEQRVALTGTEAASTLTKLVAAAQRHHVRLTAEVTVGAPEPAEPPAEVRESEPAVHLTPPRPRRFVEPPTLANEPFTEVIYLNRAIGRVPM